MKTLKVGDWLIKHTERLWTDADGEVHNEILDRMIKITEVLTSFKEPRYKFETISVIDVVDSPRSKEEHMASHGGFTHSFLTREVARDYLQLVK